MSTSTTWPRLRLCLATLGVCLFLLGGACTTKSSSSTPDADAGDQPPTSRTITALDEEILSNIVIPAHDPSQSSLVMRDGQAQTRIDGKSATAKITNPRFDDLNADGRNDALFYVVTATNSETWTDLYVAMTTPTGMLATPAPKHLGVDLSITKTAVDETGCHNPTGECFVTLELTSTNSGTVTRVFGIDDHGIRRLDFPYGNSKPYPSALDLCNAPVPGASPYEPGSDEVIVVCDETDVEAYRAQHPSSIVSPISNGEVVLAVKIDPSAEVFSHFAFQSPFENKTEFVGLCTVNYRIMTLELVKPATGSQAPVRLTSTVEIDSGRGIISLSDQSGTRSFSVTSVSYFGTVAKLVAQAGAQLEGTCPELVSLVEQTSVKRG